MSELVNTQSKETVKNNSFTDMFDVMEKAYQFSQIIAKSDIIPSHYRNKPENVFVAIQMAYSMKLDPILLIQNTFVIASKNGETSDLGTSSAFGISLANTSGLLLSGIRYRIKGEGDNLNVTAYTTLKLNNEEISFTFGMQQAIAAEWTKNSQYKSLPELMLSYRAAIFLIRTHIPQVLKGMHMVEEMDDVNASKKIVHQQESSTSTSTLDDFLEKETSEVEEKEDLGEVEVKEEQEDSHLKLAKLVEVHNVPKEKIQAWCQKGGVDDLKDLDEEKTVSCIKYMESLGGVNGHASKEIIS